jgi:predicted amidohydrolase YtcJ
MTKRISLMMVAMLLVACGSQEVETPPPPAAAPVAVVEARSEVADAVYTNGKIYTVNQAQPWVEAIAIKNGKFLVVGTNAEAEAASGSDTQVVDLGGRMAMPGLIDVHVHPLSVAQSWANLKIENPGDADAILEQLRRYVEANPDVSMIRGEPWNLGVFPGDSPRKEPLDRIVADRPVYLISQTGHSAWVNSKALEMAGITKETPATSQIVFDTDKETGEPSGTVREFAMGLVEKVLAPTPVEQFASSLQSIAKNFNSYGFTALQPAEGSRSWMEGATYLDSQGGLSMRLFPAWDWHTSIALASTNEEADQLIARWSEFVSPLVYPRYVKMYYDTSPDSYTALLLDDYVGRPGNKGHSNLPKQDFLAAIAKFNADGLGVLVHVLGDGGARELVDVFTDVRERNGDNGVLMHFSHAWMAHPEDIQRLSEVAGTCIDFSPALNYPAPEIIGSMVPPLGEERYQKFFNVKSAFDAGMPVGFGSDWASALIPEPNGFHQMQSWITRQDPQNPSSGTLNASQAITLEQAVRGFTLGGAQCLGFGWPEKIGSIEQGKLADFIVLDRNIFESPISKLYETQVEQTVLGGKVVFDRSTDVADSL